MLYSEIIWQEWVAKIEKDFKKKGYEHFDIPFDFPARKLEIKSIVASPENVKAHSFAPLIKILIKTPRFRYQEDKEELSLDTKIRPISFASHFDAYIYSFYSFALNKKYLAYIKAQNFSNCVLAYRTDLNGKSNIQFAKEVFDYIKQKGECTAIALDIKGYFDNIDHGLLKEKWCKITETIELPIDEYKVFRSLTKYTYINKYSLLKHFKVKIKKLTKKPKTILEYVPNGETFNDKMQILRDHNLLVRNENHVESDNRKRFFGIPQGSSISALLSNIYLIDYDKFFYDWSIRENFLYRRYCDDILIVCDSDKSIEIQKKAIEKIGKYFLTIQDKKVDRIDFLKNSRENIRGFNSKKFEKEPGIKLTKSNEDKYHKNLQYLGFEFGGKDVYIRSSSLSRYFRKMKARISKTILMAYSKNSKGHQIFKQQLFHRYTHLGKRNFLHYAYNASKEYYINSEGIRREGFNSAAIKRQLKSHFSILISTLRKKRRKI